MSLLPFWAWNVVILLLSICRVRKLLDFFKTIFICVPKMNEGLTGLEPHEGDSLLKEFTFFVWTIPLRFEWLTCPLSPCCKSNATWMQHTATATCVFTLGRFFRLKWTLVHRNYSMLPLQFRPGRQELIFVCANRGIPGAVFLCTFYKLWVSR